MDIELQRVEAAAAAVAVKERQFWVDHSAFQLQMRDFYEAQSQVETGYQRTLARLEKLKKTNVYNDAFHIWHDGHFGTINRFRLGRLPTVPVEWAEINAAWGQTLLLLHTMATKLGFLFQKYRLIPYGSNSRIERLPAPGTSRKREELPLFGSGSFKRFWESKFDQAMVAFLHCLSQFMQHVESRDEHFKLPYSIKRDTIGDRSGNLSIKIHTNKEENWTKALKYMLTNLKWCLAWVCKQV